jgi:hypothetical protein
LEPPQWIDVHFGGDVPVILSGEITNLEEDMIELTTYPGMRVVYVDFAYQGIPEDLPIERIVLRERPKALGTSLRAMASDQSEIVVEEEATMEFDEEAGQLIINVPEGASVNPSPAEVVEEFLEDADFAFDDDDDDLPEMRFFAAVPESERRYTEEMQVNDLLGELVSKTPVEKRTPHVMKDIHRFVSRFKELRRLFSKFDDNGNVLMPLRTDVMNKPLINRIMALDREIKWLLPVVREDNELVSLSDEDNYTSHENRVSIPDLLAELAPVNRVFYNKQQIDVEGNIYDYLARLVDDVLKTHTSDPNATAIKTNLECVVSNDANFGSDVSVVVNGEIHEVQTRRFVNRRYSVASSRMIQNDRRVYSRIQIGYPDTARVRSIVMLPRQVLLQSQTQSPSANLYLKSKLAEIPVYKHLILKSATTLQTIHVDNLDKEMSYENACSNFNDVVVCKEVDEQQPGFLVKPTHYSFAPPTGDDGDDATFRRFLNAIIPRTHNLLYWLKPSLSHLYSYVDVIAALEPFLVEQENITFTQWKDVRYYIKEKIKKYKLATQEQRTKYASLKRLNSISSVPANRINMMWKEDEQYQDRFLKHYPALKDDIERFSSETLHNIISMDGGASYTALLNLYLISVLTIPESVMGVFKPPVINSDQSEIVAKSACEQRFLTKKYTSIAAMRKDDNTKDVFYDKQYDDTPYFLLDKYKDEKKRFRVEEDFHEFFVETLIQKHDCPPHLARTLANTIISKKKRVQVGEYAMLEIRPTLANKLKEASEEEVEREVEQEAETRKHVEYYKRNRSDVWELDRAVSVESFVDTNTLFCELSESCNKLTSVGECVPKEMAVLQMRLSKRARMMEEFENRIARSFEEVEEELRVKLAQMGSRNRRAKIIDENRQFRQNDLSYQLGQTATSTELVKISPHADLRDRILGWPDFAERQNMIYVFVDKFCREPNLGDDPNWKYCKDTNTHLFPGSIHELAMGFFFENYESTLDSVVRRVGRISDDGDAIVDMYTGFTLRQIEYSAEEGYDEAGFRISTNNVVEERDIANMVLDVLNKETKVFDDPTHQMVYNVFRVLSENMGIHKETAEASIAEFVMRVSLEMLRDPTIVKEEDAYNEEIAQMAKQQTKRTVSAPYKTYYNQILIMIVGCNLFTSIQTLIPSFKSKKTFPGCVKSFAGYPLEEGNPENSPGLRYLACVLAKTKQSSSQPWSSIEQFSLEIILKRLKIVMRATYKKAEVRKLYDVKRNYLVNYPDEAVPAEVSVERWIHFQPPLIEYVLDGRAATGITEDFEKELFSSIRSGSSQQFIMIGALKGKALKHGYAVADLVGTVVKKKRALLNTNGGEAFLENACCNEDGTKTDPLSYFIQERPELEQLLKKTRKVEEVLVRVRGLSRPKTFYDPKSSRLVGAAVPDTIISRVVYETFIHYCNFDNDAPIPTDLLVLASSKPEYNRFASMDDKIAFLKRHGKNYGVDEFHSLMRIVNGRNMIVRKPDKSFKELDGLKDILGYFEDINSNLVEDKLRELLRETLADYDPKVAVHEERASTRKLNRYLLRANEGMREVVMAYMKSHSRLTTSQLKKTDEFLKTVADWQLSDAKSASKEVQNMVYNIAKLYPNKLLTSSFQTTIPKHWNYSDRHMLTLKKEVSAFYKNIGALVEEELDQNGRSTGRVKDSAFVRYLKSVVRHLTDLVLFMEQVPIFAPVVNDGVEYWHLYSNETVKLLHQYCVLSVLNEYIVASNDREFLQMRAEEIKTHRRRPGVSESDFLEEDDGAKASNRVQRIRIVEGDLAELKQSVGAYLVAILDRENETKQAINHNYAEIMKRTMVLKYKDKKTITDFLAGLSRDERRVEQTLRSHKIGRWNIGLQKGLYQYQKDIYDKETANLEEPAIVYGEMGDASLEVEDLAMAEREQQSADYDGGDGWDNLNEDYTDGIYYEEDAERGDYDEY